MAILVIKITHERNDTMEPVIDDGGQAFPGFDSPGATFIAGMSLRQHYAGLAMQSSLIARGLSHEVREDLVKISEMTGRSQMDQLALHAMESADAMIRAGHTPPQNVEQPFDVATIPRHEREALVNLRAVWLFHSLPADIKAKAEAAAEFIEPVVDDGCPF